MSISEFKNRINFIMNFVFTVNELNIPDDTKKSIVKMYANMLSINLTDNMVDNIIKNTLTCA